MIASDFIASEDGHNSVTKATIDDDASHNEDFDNKDEEFDYSDEEEEYLVDDNSLDDDLESESDLTDDDKIFEDDFADISKDGKADDDEGDDDEFYDEDAINGVNQSDNDDDDDDDYLGIDDNDDDEYDEEIFPNNEANSHSNLEQEAQENKNAPDNTKYLFTFKRKDENVKNRPKRDDSKSLEAASLPRLAEDDFFNNDDEKCDDENESDYELWDTQTTKCRPGYTFCMETGLCTSGSCSDGPSNMKRQMRYSKFTDNL